MKKIIYDLGASDGCNIPYYLSKSDLVVAVEANPHLCKNIIKKFSNKIKDGNLVIENCIVTNEQDGLKKKFFIHKSDSNLGQYPVPSKKKIQEYKEISVITKNVSNIIKYHGTPFYVKIDLEFYDNIILREIIKRKIQPEYLSIEAFNKETISLLSKMKNYKAFKIVNGKTISKRYNSKMLVNKKTINFFGKNSAGPFGDDISGDWMTFKNMCKILKYSNIGWNDIHCSRIDVPHCNYTRLPEMKFKNKIKFYFDCFLKKTII